MSRVLLASMVVATALGAAFLPAHALAGFPGQNGRIVFLGSAPGYWEPQLFLIDADGNGRTQISFGGYHYDPAWSADGRSLAFGWADNSDSDIWIADGDGSNRRRITSGSWYDFAPAWSPDGLQVAFTRETPSTTPDIFEVSSTGGEPSNLTANAANDTYPKWSPDGTRIAFASDRAGESGIYVMNPDGSNPLRLADRGTMPDWSPDGSQIMYARQHTSTRGRPFPIGPPPPPPVYYQLWQMNADGSNPHRLTYEPGDHMFPAWSPDSTHVAYSGWLPGGGYQQLSVLDLASRASQHLTQGYSPSWQPLAAPLPPPPPPAPPPPPPAPPPPPPQPPPPPPPPPVPPPPVPPPPPPAPRCHVPRVVGRTLPRARRVILRARCRVGRVRRVRSRRAGRVLAQRPREGAVKPAGFAIKLVVGRS